METITISYVKENLYMATSDIYKVEGYGSTPKKALKKYRKEKRKLIKRLKRQENKYISEWI